MLHDMRHLSITGAHNVRDLGGYRTAGGLILPWRRFLRADSLHRLEPGEDRRLLDEGLTTVIDLRTPTELAEAPNPFANRTDVDFHNLPLFDDLAPASLGQAEATSDDPLLDFYIAALHQRRAAIRNILGTMSEAREGAILFNCTAGKDRTGIVAALLLGLAGVGREDIIADYALSADLISKLVAEFLELSRQRGGDTVAYARMLRSPAQTMEQALASIEQEHGTLDAYLAGAGLTTAQIDSLRARLTGRAG
ncbi:tyrosine-protein phosphatase [Seohaeicola nanhaiensis]|uniref:Tyrosine-protein phosphatase n=1 Tax=Seohaeicola nanhaiensis TaxID=1387282 RepID=A0ABV9KDU6_9RHOB